MTASTSAFRFSCSASTLKEARLLISEGDQRPGVRREIAAIFAANGNRDSALKWLSEAIGQGWRHEALRPSPWIQRVRNQPGYKEVLARMQVDIDSMKERVRRDKIGASLPLQ